MQQPGQVRVIQQRLDDEAAEPAVAMLRQDENVRHPGEGGAVGHRTRHTDLRAIGRKQTDDEGAGQGASHDVARHAGRAIGGAEELVHHLELEPTLAVVSHIVVRVSET